MCIGNMQILHSFIKITWMSKEFGISRVVELIPHEYRGTIVHRTIIYRNLWGHMVSSCLTFWEAFSVFQSDLPFYILTSSIWGFQISPYPHEYLLLLVLLITAIPISMKQHFILFFICIFTTINDTEYFFMCLLIIYIFFGEISIKIFCPFLIG